MATTDGPAAGATPRARLVIAVLAVLAVLVVVLVVVLWGREDDGVATASPTAVPTTSSAEPTSPVSALPSPPDSGSAPPTASASPSTEPSTAVGEVEATPAGAVGSTGSPTIPGRTEDPASVPATRVLLCDVTRARVESLLGPGGAADAEIDDLRVGSEVLIQVIPDWRDGARGYPLADDRLDLVQTVSDSWDRAIAASDAGDADASDGFVDEADAALEELGALDPLPGC